LDKIRRYKELSVIFGNFKYLTFYLCDPTIQFHHFFTLRFVSLTHRVSYLAALVDKCGVNVTWLIARYLRIMSANFRLTAAGISYLL